MNEQCAKAKPIQLKSKFEEKKNSKYSLSKLERDSNNYHKPYKFQ